MNDSANDTDPRDHEPPAEGTLRDDRPATGKPRRRFLLFGGLGLAAIAGLLSTRAWAHGHGAFAGGRGHGHGMGGMDAASAAELRERLGHVADRVLGHLDASGAQRERIGAVLDREAPRLFELHKRGRDLHEQAHQAFAAGDRQALELARSRAVQWMDELSAQALSTLHELHDVLDAEQQAELREHMAHRRGRGGHGRRHGFWH